MSNLKEKVVVPDVWSGKKLEKDIAEFKSGRSKEIEKLRRKVAELEYDLDSVERAFWMGVIGLTIFNLAVVAMFVF
ncbi:MAG: hypothetical protein HXL76_06295 [[Eubacterium] sulci]|nr:hypothetical protein [[Eubacterium] sulci]